MPYMIELFKSTLEIDVPVGKPEYVGSFTRPRAVS